MKQSRLFTILYHSMRIILGFVFIYASVDKILNPAQFAKIIYHYRAVPLEFINLIAVIQPWLEATLGVLFLLNIKVRPAAFIMGLSTIMFIILIASAMARGLNIECGCFSLDPVASRVGWQRLIEDIIMLVGIGYVFFFPVLQHINDN